MMPRRVANDYTHVSFNLSCSEQDLKDNTWTTEHITIVLLHAIRDELRKLNTLLSCNNFTNIPHTLKRIDRRLSTTRKLTRGRVAKP